MSFSIDFQSSRLFFYKSWSVFSSRFQFQVVFHGARSVFIVLKVPRCKMVFCGAKLVFTVSGWLLRTPGWFFTVSGWFLRTRGRFFRVPGWFFMVQGGVLWLPESFSWFRVGLSWFQVGFYLS